ncbi:unnamed protein product [Didymodactylos carnosus]|uniref:Uncharacterized protein n=1 Tax=Didymodactylos carnosus TaxID=1234261 RepID=A0A8S2IRY5_9BILA|nr:unnamed protein product [Didymodactylos carnosus]CAF3763747.1 unnamed protein product [Didymodactylos carnosus]
MRLSERIEIFVGFLQEKNFDMIWSEPMKRALIYFAIFLQECHKRMNTFTKAGSFKRLWNNKGYFHQLTDLHTEFTQRESVGCNSSLRVPKQPLMITNCEDAECQERQQSIFTSGIWKYQHYSNEKWQDPSHFELIFDPNTKTLRGFGEDSLNRFTLNGAFDERIRVVKMIWSFKGLNSAVFPLALGRGLSLMALIYYETRIDTNLVYSCDEVLKDGVKRLNVCISVCGLGWNILWISVPPQHALISM